MILNKIPPISNMEKIIIKIREHKKRKIGTMRALKGSSWNQTDKMRINWDPDRRIMKTLTEEWSEIDWKLCNVTLGPDYIPCLDNIKAIKKLKSLKQSAIAPRKAWLVLFLNQRGIRGLLNGLLVGIRFITMDIATRNLRFIGLNFDSFIFVIDYRYGTIIFQEVLLNAVSL